MTVIRDVELARQTVHPKEALAGSDRRRILKRCKAYLAEAQQAGKRWRPRAEEAWSFYDGEQWKAKDMAVVKARGQAPITINETTRTIDLVLGLQSVQPFDWLGRPMGDGDNDVGEVSTHILKFIANVNYSRDVFSEAYLHSMAYAVGWIRVGDRVRDPNPKAEKVQFVALDPREILPDPKQRYQDYSDARFIIHRRKATLGAVQWLAKKYRVTSPLEGIVESVDVTKEAGNEPGITDLTGVPPVSAWGELDWNQAEKVGLWRQNEEPEGREVWINELWEKYTDEAIVAWTPEGVPVEIDMDDPTALSQLADDSRFVSWDIEDVPRVRFHIWTGDLLIAVNQDYFGLDRFPFVPIWHKRDKNGDPVGLIEQMKDPQSEINHRRSRLLWGLLTRRGRISTRVLQRMGITLEEAQEMMARPDALFEAEPGDIELLPSAELPVQQFDLMQDAKLAIRSAAGINEDLMGLQTSARSGVAREIAASQGQLSLRPNEAKLRFAHKQVGQLCWHLAQKLHSGPWAIRITDDVGASRFFVANKPDVDPETNMPHVLNDIQQMQIDIEIDDTAWSPTMQQRASQILLDLVGQIPDPGTRMKVMALAILAGDIPKKKQILDIVKELMEPKQAIMPTPRPPTTQVPMDALTPMEQAQLVRRAGLQPDPARGQMPSPPGTPVDGSNGGPSRVGMRALPVAPGMSQVPAGSESVAPPWALAVPGGVE